MSRLLRVELRRLWARQITRWACVGVLALAAISGLAVYLSAPPPSAQEVANAQEMFAADQEAWETDGEQQVASCEADAEAEGRTPEEWGCDQMAPRLEYYLPPTQTFVPDATQQELMFGAEEVDADDDATAAAVEEIRGSVWNGWAGLASLDDVAVLLVLVALVVGVSFVTAEINSGSLGMWLTFEPRRQRVYWAKAAAAALGTVPLVLVGFALLVAASYAVYASFGTLGGLTGAVWLEVAAFTGRLVAAGAALAAVGVALGVLFKHAAAAVGVVGVVAWGSLVFGFGLGELQRWLPTTALTAWLQGGSVFSTERCTPSADGVFECLPVDHVVTTTQGGLTLLAVTAVLTLLAALVFRRRDVS
ncbi:ABC transporter permease subunit [Krasilnikoviella flava]|uniref:ABC-2 type transport system permease protein n=1 Tax=Krasilnikoviella flava TaxID=526729 RepID=A0A1T5KPF9_9MICO|nr:ABC transporter permease subunit [Krasilnikoviella flava]SKC65577.1 ABC-2 type transport system permease protein [Krasilnikoviella flava]